MIYEKPGTPPLHRYPGRGNRMSEAEWLEKLRNDYYQWASDDQWECCLMLFDLVCGQHHLTNKIKPWGDGIEYNTHIDFSTFDFSRLTTAVFMAHDRCIRFSINSSGPRLLKLCLFKRHGRDGEYWKKHPTLEQAVETYRKTFPNIEPAPVAGKEGE